MRDRLLSRRPVPRLPVLLACLLAWTAAQAQTPAAPPAQPPPRAAAAAAPLPPAQAQQALDVLRDDKRRAELIATLDAIAKAAPPTTAPANRPGAATPTPTTPAPTIATIPLEPDALGVQLVDQVSAGLAAIGAQFMASLRSVNDLPLLWRWIANTADDADARALLAEAAWKMLVMLAAGLAAEAAAGFLLQRPKAALARGAHRGIAPPPPPDVPLETEPASETPYPSTGPAPEAAAEPADPPDLDSPHEDGTPDHEKERTTARARRLAGAINAIRRLPFLIGRLALDLVPIALFAAVADFLLGTTLGAPAQIRTATLFVIQCYVSARLILAVSALLLTPESPRLRLLHISAWAAEFISRWIRRIAIVGITGYAIPGVLLDFGMYRSAYDALLKLFALALHAALVVAVLQAREPVARRIRARPRDPARTRTPWAILLNRLAETWHLIAIFYIVALWVVWAVELRNGYNRLIHFFLVTATIMIVSRLAAVVLLGGLDRARALPLVAASLPGLEGRAAAYFPVLRTLLMSAIAVVTTVALFQAWGLDVIGWFEGNGLGRRAVSALTTIGVTVFLAVLAWEAVNSAIEIHLARLGKSAQLARAGRLRTLLPMLRTLLLVTIILIVALMSLDELGVNIAPLLAGAGVVGIAVGFGSQKLVQDLITGLFLLLENAMQVGDVVTLGGLSGTVEALSIRAIRLRALDGSVHIIPFSAVTTVTNQTRDYSYALLDISIGLNEEPEHIVTVLKDIAETMRQETRWQGIVLEPLDVMGVEKFVDTAWVMRVRMKTQPASRWAVSRELNRRIKIAFDDQAIESPFTSYRVLSAVPGPTPTEGAPA